MSAYANGNHHFNPSSPVTVTAADLQTYQIRSGSIGGGNTSPGSIMIGTTNSGGQTSSGHHPPEEQHKKRELRLLKNR